MTDQVGFQRGGQVSQVNHNSRLVSQNLSHGFVHTEHSFSRWILFFFFQHLCWNPTVLVTLGSFERSQVSRVLSIWTEREQGQVWWEECYGTGASIRSRQSSPCCCFLAPPLGVTAFPFALIPFLSLPPSNFSVLLKKPLLQINDIDLGIRFMAFSFNRDQSPIQINCDI